MADILFTHCNHLYNDSKQVLKMQPYPPLQTMIAAAFLREKGFEVAIFDPTLNHPEQGFRASLARHNPKLVAICDDNFGVIAKMCLKQNRGTAFSMIEIARECNIPIIINSPDASDHAFEYLSNGADFVIFGEVENTLADATRHILGLSSGNIFDVPGLFYMDRRYGEIRNSAPRELETELSRFPMPAWDLIDIQSYRNAWIKAHNFFCLNLISSRGCPYSCNWCAKPIYGRTYRFVPAKRAAEEMKFLKQEYGPDQIWFSDDIFALSPRWISEFADEIDRLRARIPFKIQSRCDLITQETAAGLQRGGCSEVWLGVESGSQRVLDAMGKDICVEQIYTARNLLKNHGIRACFFLQFGYPNEEWADIQRTIHLVRETVPDDVGISVSYPLPNTAFYDRVLSDIAPDCNWSESGDLSMRFRATYKSEFYVALYRAVHLEVEMLNGRGDRSLGQTLLHELWDRMQQELMGKSDDLH